MLFVLQDKGKLLGANGLAYLNVDLSVEGTCTLHGYVSMQVQSDDT